MIISPTNLRALLVVLISAAACMAEWASAADEHYQRLLLKDNISIEVPSHWLVHSDADRKNFAAAGDGSARAAGIINPAIK
jgi:hypothetical protein